MNYLFHVHLLDNFLFTGGLCPCEDDYVLAWTYDGICDCKCIPPKQNLDLACGACPGR